MGDADDPRIDRVVATIHVLEAALADQTETIERLRAQVEESRRDAAEAREAAAFAKAETASYHAELTSRVKRPDLERSIERLDQLEGRLERLLSESAGGELRSQVVKLTKALGKVAPAAHLDEMRVRVERIDDRLQARAQGVDERLGQLESSLDERLASLEARFDAGRDGADLDERVAEAVNQLQTRLAAVSGDATDVTQDLDRRLQLVEGAINGLDQRIEAERGGAAEQAAEHLGLVNDALDEVSARVDAQLAAIVERLDTTEKGLAELGQAGTILGADVAELEQSVSVLRTSVEADRAVVADLDQRVFGADGVADRLMQLAEVVVEHRSPHAGGPSIDQALLEFQERVETLTSRVESVGILRTRLEVVEQQLGL